MKALLVIDMLKGFIYGNKDQRVIRKKQTKKLIQKIRKVIDLAHKKNIPIIYINCNHKKTDPCVKISGKHAMKGTKGAQVIDGLKPTKKDHIVKKIAFDGFYKTRLEKLLKRLKIKEIYLTGVQTDVCVRETGVSGAYRGFKVFLIEDCCATNLKVNHTSSIMFFVKTNAGKIVKSNNLKW
ncbi:MAG: isochorismatase family protein [Candidatus Aenigmarchaeota archaeon]|nr:isochorismatase family protein [Candidatus Aenigmarchaeota archaeon]